MVREYAADLTPRFFSDFGAIYLLTYLLTYLLIVSEMTYTVSSGTLNSSIPYQYLLTYLLAKDCYGQAWIQRFHIEPYTMFVTSARKLMFSSVFVCQQDYGKTMLTRFSQNSSERWHMSHGRNR